MSALAAVAVGLWDDRRCRHVIDQDFHSPRQELRTSSLLRVGLLVNPGKCWKWRNDFSSFNSGIQFPSGRRSNRWTLGKRSGEGSFDTFSVNFCQRLITCECGHLLLQNGWLATGSSTKRAATFTKSVDVKGSEQSILYSSEPSIHAVPGCQCEPMWCGIWGQPKWLFWSAAFWTVDDSRSC